MDFASILADLPGGLSQDRVRVAMSQILSGDVSDVQAAAFLFGLRVKGESLEEINGLVESLRAAAIAVPVPGPVLDIVGTGGDRTGAINISTPACIVARAAGDITVVKHGNRGASTPTGSADVLEYWGIPLDLSAETLAGIARQVGIAFCFAPQFQPALRKLVLVRRQLQVPTIINLVAPLLNPANPQYQLVGVADRARMPLVADFVHSRSIRAIVARGLDGLDKFTVTTATEFIVIQGETRIEGSLQLADVGIEPASMADIQGSTPEENARVLDSVLRGDVKGPISDIVVLNAAVALLVAENALDDISAQLKVRIERCRAAIADGRAIGILNKWVEACASFRPSA